MSETPDWALPLCPNCGSWGQGTPIDIVDAVCRASTAYLIAHGIGTRQSIIQRMRTSTEFGRNHPVADNFPEPIDWAKAAIGIKHYSSDEVREWVMQQAKEYAK